MTRLFVFSLAGLILPLALFSQTIVGIGSSTISGDGASPIDSAWLNLLQDYWTKAGLTIKMVNLGRPSSTSFVGMPSSYETPTLLQNDTTPMLGHNITAAWYYHPDIVVIAYPSNDAALGYPLSTWLANLRTIYDSVLVQGKVAWIATSQPRNDVANSVRQVLAEARDSILKEFAGHVLNFYDPLVDPATLGIKTGLTNDAIHPNNAGHQLLFQVAVAAGILPVSLPLPLSILGFSGSLNNGQVALHWKIGGSGDPSTVSIERSGDGVVFSEIAEQAIDPAILDYDCTDAHPLPGRSFYRVRLTQQAVVTYSAVVSVLVPVTRWGLGKVYSNGDGSQWTLELDAAAGGKVGVRVVDAGGRTLLVNQLYVAPPAQLITLDLSALAPGQYWLQVFTDQGPVSTRAVQRR